MSLTNYNFRVQSVIEHEKVEHHDDNDLMMFDKPRKLKTDTQTKASSQIGNRTADESDSQKIIDDEIPDTSQATASNIQSQQGIKEISNSQVIETESEDLSQFMGDVGTYDLERS